MWILTFLPNIKKIKQNKIKTSECVFLSGCVCVKFVRSWGVEGIYISTWHSQNTYISFHLIFSDFMFILWWGAFAGDSQWWLTSWSLFPFREINIVISTINVRTKCDIFNIKMYKKETKHISSSRTVNGVIVTHREGSAEDNICI